MSIASNGYPLKRVVQLDASIVRVAMKAADVLLTDDLYGHICDFGMAEAKNRSRKGDPALTVS